MKKPRQLLDGAPSQESSIIFDTAWSPINSSILACGTIDGSTLVHSLDRQDQTSLLFSLDNHKDSTRSLDFTLDGSGWFSACDPINKVKCLDDYLVATGDDSGYLK
ncbi:hypothetical protein HDU91_001862, partial [Kappamyces sp. JEL0680]